MNIEIAKSALGDQQPVVHMMEEDVENVNYENQYPYASSITKNIRLDDNLRTLLTDASLSKKEQCGLLNNPFDVKQIITFLVEASEMGYLFTQKSYEKIPDQYTEEQIPTFATITDNGEVEQCGSSMTDNGVKQFIHERKKSIVRIIHKEDIWHCFIFDYSGLAGRESGKNGKLCHCHYISNKFGLKLENLLEQISQFSHPSCCAHILLQNYK